MVHHFTLRNEFLCNKYLNYGINKDNQRETHQLVAILDCEGISLERISFVDIISFVMKSGAIIDNYYPMLVQKLFIINTSWAFQYAWGIASTALPASIKNKLFFPTLEELNKFIDPSQVYYYI